jgi:hypothetical protein
VLPLSSARLPHYERESGPAAEAALQAKRGPCERPCAGKCLLRASARRSQQAVLQERRTEFADGPVPGLCFLDAIHRKYVLCPRSVWFCGLRLALMAARQVVWRESSHRDAARQHHANTDTAAVVRRYPLSSAAACVYEV